MPGVLTGMERKFPLRSTSFSVTMSAKFPSSHMRGNRTWHLSVELFGHLSEVKDACDRHCVTLLEDCAHSLAVYWNSVHTGHMGRVATISAQSLKMINSGKGAFPADGRH